MSNELRRSATLDPAVDAEAAARTARHTALGAFLDQMDAEDGAPDTGEVQATRALFT